MCFLWISEQTAIISPYSIDWLVFITETECLLRGMDWVFIYNSTFCPHSVFMCSVWIWEQTAIISLYSINWLVCITETECVYCAGTDWIFIYNSTFCPHSVFICFVWIWERTAIISLYSINWLVFITETECVYCGVRTGSLYIIQVMCFVWIWEQTAIISPYSINWLVFITETESVYCAVRTGSLYIIQVMCFVLIWEQTAIISLYSINWLVCITEMECVYCAERAECLNTVQENLVFPFPC